MNIVKLNSFNISSNYKKNNFKNNVAFQKAIKPTGKEIFDDRKIKALEKMTKEVEIMASPNIEEELLEYDSFVRKLLKDNKGENNGKFVDSKGRKYICLHNFLNIQVEQDYKGIPIDARRYYYGYSGGKIPNTSQQFGFIKTTPWNDKGMIKYSFAEYNLDDNHSFTVADIYDGEILQIYTGFDSFSPVLYKLNYDNNKLQYADGIIHDNSTTKMKNSRFFFDENRKVKKVLYGIQKDSADNIISKEREFAVKEGRICPVD